MDSIMMECALEYAQRGWAVFPLSADSKIPYPGSNGVKDATTDEKTIRSWWTVHPDANIGLACGEPSGVWVIDIDVGHKKDVDGFKTLLNANISLPPTLCQRTPSGGRHCLYKVSPGLEPPRNKNNFMPGIDIRGTGYYIVLAPSSIGVRRYAFEAADAELAEFPDFMKPSQPKSSPEIGAAMPWDRTPAAPAPSVDSVEDRARLYLRECDPAVQGCGGHNALMWAAQAVAVGFDLPEQTAINLLWEEYNPRCVPPWNREDAKSCKDFERKVKEANKHPIKERGWILKETSFSVTDDALDFAGSALAASFLAPKEANVEGFKPTVDPESALPDEILNPPGLVGDITRFINETAGCYQPVFALGASLTFCGALFGRKVKDESNGRTNIYGMGVGHSSAGKDHPAKCIARILQAAKCEAMLGGEVTSDTAIEICLMQSKSKLFMMDEVGHFLRTINQAGGGSPHLKTIVPMFMKLFSAANSLYVGKQRVSGGPANQIDQPCCCIWGVTSPQILFDNMTREELEGGWTARNLVFISETRPEYQFTRETKVPDSIITMVQAWHNRVIPPPDGGQNAFTQLKAHQLVIPTTPEALAVFKEFGHKAHGKMIEADKSGDVCNYLWGKALENARRIALIVTCGEQFDNAEIGVSEAKYGCQLVEFLITRLSEAVHANVAESSWEHDKQKIAKIICSAKDTGMSKGELTRKTQWVRDRRTRDEYLHDLVDASIVIFMPKDEEHGNRDWLYGTAWLSKDRASELIERLRKRKEKGEEE